MLAAVHQVAHEGGEERDKGEDEDRVDPEAARLGVLDQGFLGLFQLDGEPESGVKFHRGFFARDEGLQSLWIGSRVDDFWTEVGAVADDSGKPTVIREEEADGTGFSKATRSQDAIGSDRAARFHENAAVEPEPFEEVRANPERILPGRFRGAFGRRDLVCLGGASEIAKETLDVKFLVAPDFQIFLPLPGFGFGGLASGAGEVGLAAFLTQVGGDAFGLHRDGRLLLCDRLAQGGEFIEGGAEVGFDGSGGRPIRFEPGLWSCCGGLRACRRLLCVARQAQGEERENEERAGHRVSDAGAEGRGTKGRVTKAAVASPVWMAMASRTEAAMERSSVQVQPLAPGWP